LPPADYVLIAAIHADRARKHSSSLISACVPVAGGDPLHHRESDALLTAFLERGNALRTDVGREQRKGAYAHCQAALAVRVAEWEARKGQKVEEDRRRTLAIIEADCGQQIAAAAANVQVAEESSALSGYRKMLPIYRSKLQQAERAREARLARVISQPKPEWENRELAAVVIRVID
jgi:organic radical activating enzyme